RPLRSRRTARVFASCATLEQPEHEYTRGRLAGRDIAESSRVAGQYPSWPHSGVDDGQDGPVAWLRIGGRSVLIIHQALAVENLDASALYVDHSGGDQPVQDA